jgi:hypothetical protein
MNQMDYAFNWQYQAGFAVPYKSLEEPVRIRWFGDSKMQYMCGKCDNWIHTSARSPKTAVKGVATHQKDKQCQVTWRLKQESAPWVPPLPVVEHQQQVIPGCSGTVLNWPGKSIWRTYPWHRHDIGQRGKLPWTIHYYDVDRDEMHIRARGCLGSFGPDGEACAHCRSLNDLVQDKFDTTFNDPEAGATTNWDMRVWEQMYQHRCESRVEILRLRRDVCVLTHLTQLKLNKFYSVFILNARWHLYDSAWKTTRSSSSFWQITM